jgi:hypothetical protein
MRDLVGVEPQMGSTTIAMHPLRSETAPRSGQAEEVKVRSLIGRAHQAPSLQSRTRISVPPSGYT